MRSAFGVPVDQSDGVVLLDSNSGPGTPVAQREASVRAYTDSALEPGRFQYYAIWVFVPTAGEWTRAGSVTGMALRDHDYGNRLWELTPAVHRTTTTGLLDADNETLRTFLRLFGTQLDHIRTEYDSLLNVNDPDLVAGHLLPLLAQQYGQFFEPELGMRQMRVLLRNTVRLYRTKGTEAGVEGLVSAVSGFGARMRTPANLILDYNDASAEESIGNWTAGYVNATLERVLASDVVDAPSSLGTMRRVGVFRQTAQAAGISQVRTAASILRAIPVKPGVTYCFSAHARAGSAGGPAARIRVVWLDERGNLLSPDVDPGTTTYPASVSLQAPGRLQAEASQTGTGGATRLAGAQLNARGTLSIGGEVRAPTSVQLNAPGRLRIATGGTYPNVAQYPAVGLLPGTTTTNPLSASRPPLSLPTWRTAPLAASGPLTADSTSFAVTSTAWTRGYLFEPAPERAAFASLGMGYTATLPGQVMFWDGLQFEEGTVPSSYTDARLIDVDVLARRVNLVTNPGFEVSAAGWSATQAVTRTTSTIVSGSASGSWSPTGALVAHTVVSTTAGVTYTGSALVRGSGTIRATARSTGGTTLADGPTVALSATPQRISVSFTAAAGADSQFGLRSTGAATVVFDQVLVEAGGELREYFDGSTFTAVGDSIWEGTTGLSRSFLYPQRRAKNFRLGDLLTRYTPMGSSFRLNYALL